MTPFTYVAMKGIPNILCQAYRVKVYKFTLVRSLIWCRQYQFQGFFWWVLCSVAKVQFGLVQRLFFPNPNLDHQIGLDWFGLCHPNLLKLAREVRFEVWTGFELWTEYDNWLYGFKICINVSKVVTLPAWAFWRLECATGHTRPLAVCTITITLLC
jgi:hypothetical protein